mmetsp:Transcript_5553/g.12631  ORF Transcript_5553/g.12631 Transcript_5553/m.12631 type:complete len:220 (-) Transcript_5553:2-661(-)
MSRRYPGRSPVPSRTGVSMFTCVSRILYPSVATWSVLVRFGWAMRASPAYPTSASSASGSFRAAELMGSGARPRETAAGPPPGALGREPARPSNDRTGPTTAGSVGPIMTPAVKARAMVVVMTTRKIRTSTVKPFGRASTVGVGPACAAAAWGGPLCRAPPRPPLLRAMAIGFLCDSTGLPSRALKDSSPRLCLDPTLKCVLCPLLGPPSSSSFVGFLP